MIQTIYLAIMRACLTVVLYLLGSAEFRGRENVPRVGPYILTVNHMSKADPPLLLLAMPPIQLRFFAGEKWRKHVIFGPFMAFAGAIYINRGEVDRRALKEAMEALKTGSIFGLAPEGTRSRVHELIQAKDGAAYLASRAGVTILPVGVTNTDVLGENIKRLRRTRMGVVIGKPYHLPGAPKRAKGAELEAYTHLIMVQIAALLPARYHGHYKDSPALAALLAGEDPWPQCLKVVGLSPEPLNSEVTAERHDSVNPVNLD
jgi:1-acyl-sn-glycerol-3-phosphate acyltransferase